MARPPLGTTRHHLRGEQVDELARASAGATVLGGRARCRGVDHCCKECWGWIEGECGSGGGDGGGGGEERRGRKEEKEREREFVSIGLSRLRRLEWLRGMSDIFFLHFSVRVLNSLAVI